MHVKKYFLEIDGKFIQHVNKWIKHNFTVSMHCVELNVGENATCKTFLKRFL